ncbi:MAG: zinc transporter [Psychromonas sp.]|jgi:zinc transporter|uniref:zinc transporter ZntB n=1 Tax=Psychromonas sp. TaxID=1884585 RepID=UPI0039E3AC32
MKDAGLIYGYYLNDDHQIKPIDNLDRLDPNENYWLHFDYTFAETQRWIENHSELNPVVIAALLNEETRPRATFIDNGFLISLRGVNLSPDSDPEDMVSIRIWIDQHRIISTRRRTLLSAKEIALDIESGNGPTSACELLTQLSSELISRMSNTINDIEEKLANIEEKILDKNVYILRNDIVDLRRQIIALRRYLAPQREAMMQLQNEKHAFFSNEQRFELREALDNLMRYIEDLDSIRDRAIVVQEEIANKLNEQLNSRMYVLSIITAIFLPLGFLTGLLGVNVGGIPGSDNSNAFALFIAFLLLIIIAQVVILKRNKWY